MKGLLRWLPALAAVGTIFGYSHQPAWPDFAVGYPDWLLHGGAYSVVGVTVWYGMGGDRRRPLPLGVLVLAVGLASLAGGLDEFHQSFVPGRSATLADWAADSVGTVVGAVVAQAVAFAGLRGLWENRLT